MPADPEDIREVCSEVFLRHGLHGLSMRQAIQMVTQQLQEIDLFAEEAQIRVAIQRHVDSSV